MKKSILFFLSLIISSVLFFSCDDDDNGHSPDSQLLGEWQAVDPFVTADSIELVKYTFNADRTGSITYNFYKKDEEVKEFSIPLNGLSSDNRNYIDFTSQIFRVKYSSEIEDIIYNEKKGRNDTVWVDIPDSVIVNKDSYWRYTKYIKYLDGDSLVFTDRHGIQEHKYRKVR